MHSNERLTDPLYIQVEVGRSEDDETEQSLLHLQAYSSFGEISLLCNSPVPYTVQVSELSKLLWLDKQSFTDILDMYFFDGQTIINNLLEGKESNLRNKILESDFIIHIQQHESELAMRLNYAAHDGDLCRLRHLVEAGADPNKTDYDGRSPMV
ncbi:unnamed protein product [Ilex paraguariensis]|uniref:Potassium channel n=1 Tax=Ilex paraguariensis TaxID=185542 RepID=A0ABC8T9Y3_9AQUA